MVVAAGTQHGTQVGHIGFQQKLQGGKVVQPAAGAHHGTQFVGRQVFVEHEQVVAEVEVRFTRVAGVECAAPHVVGAALWHAHEFSAPHAQPPAQVNLLHVGKEGRVEAARGLPVGLPHHEGRARGPQHGAHFVILPLVALDRAKHAAAAKGVAIAVKVAARAAGILKHLRLALAEQFGLAGCHLGVRLHVVHKRTQPTVFHSHIAVEQQVVGRVNLGEGAVVAFGKTIVAVKRQTLHGGELAREHGQRTVCGAVVGHYHQAVGGTALHHRGQEAAQHVEAVPVQYDYRHLVGAQHGGVCC